jgi:Lysophospholipase catalytic domain
MKCTRFFLFISIIFLHSCGVIYALRLYNESDDDLYAAIYYVDKTAELQSDVVFVQAHGMGDIPRPSRKLMHDRQLVFDQDKSVLKDKYSKAEFSLLDQVNVGTLFKGDSFFVTSTAGSFEGYTEVEWKLLIPLKTQLLSLYSLITKSGLEEVKTRTFHSGENKYSTAIAKVRLGNGLCAQEKEFLEKRKPVVKKAIEKALGISLERKTIPKIAVVGSGGGYRAMLATLGFFSGFDELGLNDAVTYAAGLSGSTWAIGCWAAMGGTIKNCVATLQKNIAVPLYSVNSEELALITEDYLVRRAFGQALTIVNPYGSLLANCLFGSLGKKRQKVRLSEQAERVQSGAWFFPLYTAVDGRASVYKAPEWYEFSPYEVGSMDFAAYVPSWSFGRRFMNGSSIDFAPEQSFGFLLATFGSAMAASADLIWQKVSKNIPGSLFSTLVDVALIKRVSGKRVTWGEFHNFMRGLAAHKMTDYNRLRLVDAGLSSMNLPYPIVSGRRPERMPNVLIFVDASGDYDDQLDHVAAYAKQHGCKFPKIDKAAAKKNIVTVFKDANDPSVPVVIYLPRYNDVRLLKERLTKEQIERFKSLENFDPEACVRKDFCSTFNFQYSVPQSQTMLDLFHANILAAKREVLDAITWSIEHQPTMW